MENSHEKPNRAKSIARSIATTVARFVAVGSSIVAVGSSIAIFSWGWEVKGCWLGVGGEWSVVEERERGDGEREAESTEG